MKSVKVYYYFYLKKFITATSLTMRQLIYSKLFIIFYKGGYILMV